MMLPGGEATHPAARLVLTACLVPLGACYVSQPLTADGMADTAADPDDVELVAPTDPDADPEPDALPATPGFVVLAAGTFTMGSPESETGRGADEAQHTVELTRPFEIMAREVTQEQFEALMGYNPSSLVSCGGGCPVEMVAWDEAVAYANALSSSADLAECYTCTSGYYRPSCEPSAAWATPYDCPGYRLPTEAEWEYAARAGTTGGTYNGTSMTIDCETPNEVLEPIAWFCGNSSSTTHAAAGKLANAWGLSDMLGNVWEWCHDWYGVYPGDATDPWGPDDGAGRVVRGGSWFIFARFVRAAQRNGYAPGTSMDVLGFRLARSLH
jgi:sulfatase modifying factor 1